jgi:hypothetical protein
MSVHVIGFIFVILFHVGHVRTPMKKNIWSVLPDGRSNDRPRLFEILGVSVVLVRALIPIRNRRVQY